MTEIPQGKGFLPDHTDRGALRAVSLFENTGRLGRENEIKCNTGRDTKVPKEWSSRELCDAVMEERASEHTASGTEPSQRAPPA